MYHTNRIRIAPIDVAKKVRQACSVIRSQLLAHCQAHATLQEEDLQPELAIICGSGLGPLAGQLECPVKIAYEDIPGFPLCPVAGHAGEVVIGRLHGRCVMCLVGRAHLYEGGNVATIRTFVRTIKALGVSAMFVTSAVGSLRPEVGPGELVLITDHINFQFSNPLLGCNEETFGPRFIGLEDCYHPQLRQQLMDASQNIDGNLYPGVFLGTIGPSFETPAEIRAFSMLGGDVVGMSVIPEMIVAKHCGLPAAAVSVVTNLAAGLSEQNLSHEITLEGAAQGTERMIQLTQQFIKHFAKPVAQDEAQAEIV